MGVAVISETERQMLRGRIAQMMEGTNPPNFGRRVKLFAANEDWTANAIAQSARMIVNGKNVAVTVAERWYRVLDAMNGATTEPTPGPQIDPEEEASILKALLTEAERERDHEKKLRQQAEEIAAKINRDRHVLEERIKDLQDNRHGLTLEDVAEAVSASSTPPPPIRTVIRVSERILENLKGAS